MAHFNEYLNFLELSPLIKHFLQNGKNVFTRKESSFVRQVKCAITLPISPKEVSVTSTLIRKKTNISLATVLKRILW